MRNLDFENYAKERDLDKNKCGCGKQKVKGSIFCVKCLKKVTKYNKKMNKQRKKMWRMLGDTSVFIRQGKEFI